ncbi:hypothetical protein F5884DRAFT_111945 [Xylogone sp. PMI_703]|nr:hypothetical protein F5884DRAFT_111945 [Xylogone sp. PMI_703]
MMILNIGALLLFISPCTVFGATIFNNSQAALLPSSTTSACLAAWGTDLSCDPLYVQHLLRTRRYAQWNTTSLSALCTTKCQSSLKALTTAVEESCNGQTISLQGGTLTHQYISDLYNYKFELVCLTDPDTGDFCFDVEDTWNIAAMNEAGTATWPNYTTKLYPDPLNNWEVATDVDGTPIERPRKIQVNASDLQWDLPPAGEDYYIQRPTNITLDDSNYGWYQALEYDEYPLEIQCSSCFLNKFLLGIESQYGDIYDEITIQFWDNVQANCGFNRTLTPGRNFTGFGADRSPSPAYNGSFTCAQNITVSANDTYTCNDFALAYRIPSTSIQGLNPHLDFSCLFMSNQTFCAPYSCDVTVITERMDFRSFINQYTNISTVQFQTWNPFADPTVLEVGDTVCISPPGGVYTPRLAPQAAPTVFTTTATPAQPTPPGTFKSCGNYHEVAAGELCVQIALNYSITYLQFLSMNPSIHIGCTNMIVGDDYCVAPVNGTIIPTPSTVAAPAPTASGTTAKCYNWYTLKSGDYCGLIELEFGLNLGTLQAYNPSINNACSNLVVGNAYCIDGSGLSRVSNYTTVSAPAPTATGTTKTCYKWHVLKTNDTCTLLVEEYGLSLDLLRVWNSNINSACSNLVVGDAYCVDGSNMMATFTTVSPPATTPSGTVNPCYRWHTVVSEDSCQLIQDEYGVSLALLRAWNPSINSTCSNLVNGDAYCVDGAGRSSSLSTVAPPGPTPSGTWPTCYEWYTVVSGDSCTAIETKYGIYFDLFRAWNLNINVNCTNLQVGDAYCVNGAGNLSTTTTPKTTTTGTKTTSKTTTKTTTKATTTTGNGIATPTPIQTGMATNCNKFHLVVSGDQCGTIATNAGISLTQFYSWNPAVGSTCATLFLGYYVCIDVIGVTPTTTHTTTTTKGNGVTTPTPIQTGMVKNCDKFHLVVSGDQCGAIASNAGITLTQFYSWNPAVGSTCATLFLGYYVCIGIL